MNGTMDDFPLDGMTYIAENEMGECFIVKWSAEFPHEWIVPIPDGSAAIVHRDEAKLVRWCSLSRPMRCEGCDQNYADLPSKLCPGCQAYREHQR